MRRRRIRTGIRALGALAVAAGVLAITPQVFAQVLSMTVATVSNFAPVTLDGTTKTTTATMDNFSVTDDRGTGEGWTVTVSATQFREWDGIAYVAGGRTLPTGSLSMPAPTVAAVATESPSPSITPGPYVIDGSSIKIASAAADTGMGTYNFTQGSLTLTIPASSYAATYRSELTVSLSSGP
jgi:hypothetical protein